jgi:hypothetical protein
MYNFNDRINSFLKKDNNNNLVYLPLYHRKKGYIISKPEAKKAVFLNAIIYGINTFLYPALIATSFTAFGFSSQSFIYIGIVILLMFLIDYFIGFIISKNLTSFNRGEDWVYKYYDVVDTSKSNSTLYEWLFFATFTAMFLLIIFVNYLFVKILGSFIILLAILVIIVKLKRSINTFLGQ